MLPEPLHKLALQVPSRSENATSPTVTIAPAILRRLADPVQGAPAALAFLTLQAAQRGPGWARQTLPPLLDWLAEPCITVAPQDSVLIVPHSFTNVELQQVQRDAIEGSSHVHFDPLSCGPGDGDAIKLLQTATWHEKHSLELTPRALGFPQYLQPQLRQLLAALPRCTKLYDSLDEHRRRALTRLLAALPRGSDGVGRSGGAACTRSAAAFGTKHIGGITAAAAATCHPHPSASLSKRGERARDGCSGMQVAWVQAALQTSRLRYQRPPPQPPSQPPQPLHLTQKQHAPIAAAGTTTQVTLGNGHVRNEDGEDCGSGEEGGWWWIPDDAGDAGQRDLHSGGGSSLDPDMGAGVAPPAPPATPGGGDQAAGAVGASRRRRRNGDTGAGHRTDEAEGGDTVAHAAQVASATSPRAEACAAGGADGSGHSSGGLMQAATTTAVSQKRATPPGKRPKTATTAAAAAGVLGSPSSTAAGPVLEASDVVGAGAGNSGGHGGSAEMAVDPASLEEVLKGLQNAVSGAGGTDDAGGQLAVTSEVWRRLEALLERCAASRLLLFPYNAATATVPPPPLAADAVLHVVRQLVTPRLSGAAVRLLLAAAVFPAVVEVKRVMPRPLHEALSAAGGVHPRPLTESVLVPAVQRPQLSAGQAQLLVKATTAGPHPLPRPLQALVLRAAAAVGPDWGEAHVAVVQGLVEAAKEELEQETLVLVCEGLCAAAAAQQQQQEDLQQQLWLKSRSTAAGSSIGVPLCRLLLCLLSKHGGALVAQQAWAASNPHHPHQAPQPQQQLLLRRLHEAAASTSTFLTKPCLAKLQELFVSSSG